MEKSNNPASKIPQTTICLLDTDVIINWLTKEEDPNTDKQLWEAPHNIMKLIEEGRIKGFLTLLNLLEVRFVLRRKKGFTNNEIKEDMAKILKLLEIVIPDEVNLLEANSLQSENPFSPFDAILIAVGLSLSNVVLISRDNSLLQLGSKFLPARTPEEFLRRLKIG